MDTAKSGSSPSLPREPSPGLVCTDLVLNLTLRCPLRCSHCCYRSEAKFSGAMCPSTMARSIREAATLGSVRTVHFSGGDPFLLPDLMLRGIRLASGLGLRTAVVTSAFFAKTPRRAMATLAPMALAGLSEISVSYDDMHAAFLPPRHLLNLINAVRTLDLKAYVSVTVEPGSRIDKAYVQRLLGSDLDETRVHVHEVGINTTGRAADLANASDRRDRAAGRQVYRGPCRTVLRSIQVTSNGRVLPCCGVLPHSENMVIGSTNKPGGLIDALRTAARDPLWGLIASEGPVKLMAEATAGTDSAVSPSGFDGICSACDRLFGEPHLLDLARQRSIEKAPRSAG